MATDALNPAVGDSRPLVIRWLTDSLRALRSRISQKRRYRDVRHLPDGILRDIGLSEGEILDIRASRAEIVLLPDGRSARF